MDNFDPPVLSSLIKDVPAQLAAFLHTMVSRGATDLLLSAKTRPTLRISGDLVPLDAGYLEEAEIAALTLGLLQAEQREQFERSHDLDFSFQIEDLARFRCSAYLQRGAISLAVRALPTTIPSLSALGLPAVAAELARRPRGLVLITGPTGSGKSTTLAAMIDLINQSEQRHIITIEDPIEYVHHNKFCLVEQREVGADTPSFPRALRSIFRQNPDVILVGEMRDPETIQTVLTLAETGHLTLTTLHTNSCANAVNRIVDTFPSEQQAQVKAQLGLSLEGVITQALLPRIGGGLALATEVMVATPAIKTMIREGRGHQLYSAIQAGQKYGMRTMNQSLADLVLGRAVKEDDAIARTSDPRELLQLVRR